MKLLVITRKVDVQDERMGFFIDWLIEFARKTDKLFVICLEKGDTSVLPESVEVFSLGKEQGYSRLRKYLRYRKFLKELLPQADGVFIHMIPLYVNLAGSLIKKHHKKLVFWYTHKSVDKALERTQSWVDVYITASRLSFRMKTNKPVEVLGHGIPVEKFKVPSAKQETKADKFKIITVGRVSPSKHLETLIESIKLLVIDYRLQVTCSIIGAPARAGDDFYLSKLKNLVAEYQLRDHVEFVGPVAHIQVIDYFHQADVFVNLSTTGSVDKTVLEAMASGTLILTSNEAFREVLGQLAKDFMFKPGDSQELALRLQGIYNLPHNKYSEYSQQLEKIVEQQHNLDNLIDKIILLFK